MRDESYGHSSCYTQCLPGQISVQHQNQLVGGQCAYEFVRLYIIHRSEFYSAPAAAVLGVCTSSLAVRICCLDGQPEAAMRQATIS